MFEAELMLSNGRITVIDVEDLEKVSRWHWHARFCKPSYYAARTTSKWIEGIRKVRAIYLHRFLMNAPAGLQVDHLNADTLDNRKSNLQLVTPEENLSRRRFK